MEWAIILPILAFLVLAAMFALFLRRAGRLIAATRDVERFRRQVADLASRVDTSLGELCARVDAVRRGQLAAPAVVDDIAAHHVGRTALDDACGDEPPTFQPNVSK